MRGGRLLRGERSTTKNDRTAVWGTEHRKNLLHRWGRLRSAALYWLRRPQPQTRKLKLSYDRVRERWGQVRAAPNPVSLTYTSPAGTQVSVVINYKAYTVATNYGISGISEFAPTNVPLVDNVTLPDGSRYAFTYEPTPSTPASGACTPLSGTYATNCVTARMTSITLPTGGQIQYSYSGGSNGILSDGSASTLTRTVTPGGVWTYSR